VTVDNGRRNNIILKVAIGVLSLGLVSAGGGIIKLYRDVGILQTGTHLERRIDTLERLLESIDSDRHKRTEIIIQFRENFERIDRRLNALEGRK
jgi:hypothetical protein